MPSTISIDPVTRLEGHLKVEVTVDTVSGRLQVVDAKSTGTLFRGIETILTSRNPLDGPDITQRICGVCPVAHGMAATITLESAANFPLPDNARLMRNLVLGSNFVQSHILHFYHLAALDYIDGPPMPPWQPTWSVDRRFDSGSTAVLVDHYVTALAMRRKAHEMGALFGGRLPHPPTFVPGGFTTTPRPARINAFKTYLSELLTFIKGTYLTDVLALAGKYSDYYQVGKGHGNLLAYGVFDENALGSSKLLSRGYLPAGASAPSPLDVGAIAEQVTYSWYSDSTNGLPPASGATTPQHPKPDAYSWLKAPRYWGVPCEVGPLARMRVSGKYPGGVSVMDRHAARAQETLVVADALLRWVNSIDPSGPIYQIYITPSSASAYGLTEAARGALGHWVDISGGMIANYQVITPTCWNASPRDSAGVCGPIEQALIGTPVSDITQPVEVLRVIHSFDPCLSCAVHVMRPAEGARIFALGHHHTEGERDAGARHH